jgi:hypothetical protein
LLVILENYRDLLVKNNFNHCSRAQTKMWPK